MSFFFLKCSGKTHNVATSEKPFGEDTCASGGVSFRLKKICKFSKNFNVKNSPLLIQLHVQGNIQQTSKQKTTKVYLDFKTINSRSIKISWCVQKGQWLTFIDPFLYSYKNTVSNLFLLPLKFGETF